MSLLAVVGVAQTGLRPWLPGLIAWLYGGKEACKNCATNRAGSRGRRVSGVSKSVTCVCVCVCGLGEAQQACEVAKEWQASKQAARKPGRG